MTATRLSGTSLEHLLGTVGEALTGKGSGQNYSGDVVSRYGGG